jgi:uncharacterized delta-60 repeat protein
MKTNLQIQKNNRNSRGFFVNQTALLLLVLIICINSSLFAQSGALDATFLSGTATSTGNVASIAVQSDGKVVIGGTFTSYNGTSVNRICRVNMDGSLDATFNVGAGASATVTKLLLQADGKIIMVGNFTSYKGTSINRIVRLNNDGTIDGTFAVGLGANNQIYSAAMQADGKIIIAGTFTSYKGTSISRIARINTDGSLDGTFAPGTGPNSWVYDMAIQTDGKIVLVGDFASYNGTTVNKVARITSTGALDNLLSFNAGTAISTSTVYGYAVDLQSDGKIIIGGSFTSFNGSPKNRLVRLNTNGSIDNSFNVGGSNSNNTVFSCKVLSDNKILLGGAFSNFNGSTPARFICLNSDGTKDATFNIGGAGANVNSILDIQLNSNNDIYIGGSFTAFNGTTRNKLAKVNKACSTASVSSVSASNYTICGSGSTTLTVTGSLNDATNWQWYNSSCGSGSVGSGSTIVVSPTSTTTYYVRGEGSCNSVACSTISINVFANPSISVTPSATTICLGSLIMLNASGANTYTWNPGNLSGASAAVGPTVNTTYTVNATDNNGCSSSALSVVTVSNCISLTQLTTTWCNTTLTTMSSSTRPRCDAVSGATNYEWQFTDVSTGTVVLTRQRGAQWPDFYLTSYFPTIQYNKTYSIKVRALVGGIWGNYGPSCTLTTPTALGGLTELTPTFCNTSLTTLDATTRPRCNSVTGATNYEWQFSNPTTGTILFTRQRNAPYTDFYLTSYWPGIAFSTTYNVKVRAYTNGVWGAFGNICTLTTPATASGRFSLTQSEMDELDMKNNIAVNAYPNPVNDILNIDLNTLPLNTKIEVYNSIGELVLTQILDQSNNTVKTQNLATGLYHVKIMSNGTLFCSQKIIKQ